jgi:endonuclease/exonuclease/phosphatase family metal-dependent hydrolase
MNRIKLSVILIFIVNSLVAQDTISVMYYNLLNFPGSTPERSDTLRKIVQYVQPDILVVNELISEVGADLILNNALNEYGISHYKRAQFIDGYNTDDMLFFDSTILRLYSQSEIGTQLRDINEYILYTLPVSTDTTFLNIYSAHLKASSGSTNSALRAAEVKELKDHLDQRNSLENVIFGGDMNFYSNTEAGYDTVLMGGNVDLFDPINASGNWHDNSFYADIHTQSTRTTQFNGGAHGGCDDRFDFIFCSSDVLNGSNGVTYVADSYRAIGQDGLRFNGSLITPINTSEADSVISALYYMSDHLPVIMELEITGLVTQVSGEAQELNVNVHYSRGTLYISNLKETMNCIVFDSLGRIIYSQSHNVESPIIKLPVDLRNGIYHYSIQGISSGKMKSGGFMVSSS